MQNVRAKLVKVYEILKIYFWNWPVTNCLYGDSSPKYGLPSIVNEPGCYQTATAGNLSQIAIVTDRQYPRTARSSPVRVWTRLTKSSQRPRHCACAASKLMVYAPHRMSSMAKGRDRSTCDGWQITHPTRGNVPLPRVIWNGPVWLL